jgi:putative endonuclease
LFGASTSIEQGRGGFHFEIWRRRLVWFESCDEVSSAISREKEIKRWRHDWKIRLVERDNPDWLDRYLEIAR